MKCQNTRDKEKTLKEPRMEKQVNSKNEVSEWHQTSQQQHWKLEDSGVKPSEFWVRIICGSEI